MTTEILLLPLAIAAAGYVLFTVRDFLRSLVFASLTVEELGSFMEATVETLRPHLLNKNWLLGHLSMTKVSADRVRLGREEETLGLDTGFYLGWYRRRPILVTVADEQLQGFGDWVPRHPMIRVWTLRPFAKLLIEFVREVKERERPVDLFTTGAHTTQIHGRVRSGFGGLFLPGDMAAEVERHVRWFVSPDGERWHRERHQPYKLVYLLHGAPGTGKSALARAIADVTRRTLVHMRLVSSGDGDLSHEVVSFIAGVKNSVVLFDEVDKLFLTENESSKRLDPATLLGLLNGELLDGQILVLTANDLSLIPETFRDALLRSRRVDVTYEFGPPTEGQRRAACEFYGVDLSRRVATAERMSDVLEAVMEESRRASVPIEVDLAA